MTPEQVDRGAKALKRHLANEGRTEEQEMEIKALVLELAIGLCRNIAVLAERR